MSIDVEHTDIVFVPIETYNGDQDTFLDAVNKSIDNKNKVLYVDCQKLQSISSSHVSLLWKAMQLCKDNNVRFVLKNVKDSINHVFATLDLSDIFIVEDKDDKNYDSEETIRYTSISFKPLKSKFIPTVENIVKEKYAVGTHLNQAQMLNQIIFEVQTIFYEVVTNIRLHSGIKKQTPIEYSISQMNNSIVLRFTDSGNEFDPTQYEKVYSSSKAIKERMMNGFGIMMIKRMSDMVTYERVDSKNILTITKSWSKYNEK